MLSSTSPTSATPAAVVFAQPDDDRVFVAALAELRGLACRPTLVWIVLATLVTDMPSIAALGRSTRTASSGRPSSRPTRTSRDTRRAVHHALARPARPAARSSRSWPRISSESGCRRCRRRSGGSCCWLPPAGLARTMTPGRAGQLRAAGAARSARRCASAGPWDEHDADLAAVASPPPPKPPPPPPPW